MQEICAASGTLRRSPIQVLTWLTLLNFIERTKTVCFNLLLTYLAICKVNIFNVTTHFVLDHRNQELAYIFHILPSLNYFFK